MDQQNDQNKDFFYGIGDLICSLKKNAVDATRIRILPQFRRVMQSLKIYPKKYIIWTGYLVRIGKLGITSTNDENMHNFKYLLASHLPRVFKQIHNLLLS